MWTNNVKPGKPSRNWHRRALLVDLEKTRLVFVEKESASSEAVPPLTHSELIETEQAQSLMDRSEVNLAIQEFQFSVTYYVNPLEEQEKGKFGFHWLGEVFSHIYALLA